MGGALMSTRESQFHHYFQQVQAKRITLKKVSELASMCYRQVKRLWKKFKEEGSVL